MLKAKQKRVTYAYVFVDCAPSKKFFTFSQFVIILRPGYRVQLFNWVHCITDGPHLRFSEVYGPSQVDRMRMQQLPIFIPRK